MVVQRASRLRVAALRSRVLSLANSLYGALGVKLLPGRLPPGLVSWSHVIRSGLDGLRSEGSSPLGTDHRAASLYSVDPGRIMTMMQPCASAARLCAAGPFCSAARRPMLFVGSPPPRIVIGGSSRGRGRAPKPGTCFLLQATCSSRRPQRDALRHVTGGHQAPEGDQQLSRHSHDHGLARAATGVRGPRPVPAC